MQANFISRILKHKTAANLFLILMFILGLYSSKELNTQFFPNYSIDYITINVEWPGASPRDIEESIIKPIEETSEEEWDKTIDVNLKSIFLGCKTFLPNMREQKNGSIINISSIAGIVGLANCSAYNASKGGVRLLTKNIAIEYGDYNVRCNSIHPGFMATNMNDPKVVEARGRDISALTDAIPLKRMGTAEDIANCALFLASDESVYVTGSEFVIDGGTVAK